MRAAVFPFQDKRCPSNELNRATWILTWMQRSQQPSFRRFRGCINKQEEGSRPFGKEFVGGESSRPQLPSHGELFDYIRNYGVLPGVGERG